MGHEVGEYHVTHDRLVRYMEKLDEVSDRISLEITGYTHEKRPLLLLTITSPENHVRLEAIRDEHARLADPGQSSGLKGADIERMLKNTVILFDPSFNPDGMQRFSSWVNSRRSRMVAADPNDMEHHEPWPGGRTNHYWFDLNRDWLVAQHPESQARIKKFHQWKPNLLTDHHEMGTHYSFFFQPGVPSRTHPITPARNIELTRKIGEFHAKALDSIGSFYYTQEGFDDF